MEREQVEERDNGVAGYDLPPCAGMLDLKIWETVEPPVGTVYNYPIRKWHDAKSSLTAFEASPAVAVQVYNRAIHNQLMARIKEGQSIKQVIAWTKDELDGFVR
jgi:hypothetical protein